MKSLEAIDAYRVFDESFARFVSLKTLDTIVATFTRLMTEVEFEEKAAEQAKAEVESAWNCSDMIAKLNKLQQAQLHHASKVNAQKQHIATEMETLQLCMASLLDNGNRSLKLFDEIDRDPDISWTLASMKWKLTILKKQEGDAYAAVAVAYEEKQMKN